MEKAFAKISAQNTSALSLMNGAFSDPYGETPSERESYASLYHWIALNFAEPDGK